MPGGLDFRSLGFKNQAFFASMLKALIPMQRGNPSQKSRHATWVPMSADMSTQDGENNCFLFTDKNPPCFYLCFCDASRYTRVLAQCWWHASVKNTRVQCLQPLWTKTTHFNQNLTATSPKHIKHKMKTLHSQTPRTIDLGGGGFYVFLDTCRNLVSRTCFTT